VKILDLGCATGIILDYLCSSWEQTTGVGVDIDGYGLHLGHQNYPHLHLVLGDAMNLPFKACTFDLVICSQVYEHVPDWLRMLREIHRVLRPGGICFFSGPNKFWIFEDHYRLPLLSWLPRRLAHLYVRALTKYPGYHEMPASWSTLRRGFGVAGFDVVDYTWRILERPRYFGFRGVRWRLLELFVTPIPKPLRPILTWISPNFNVVLQKRDLSEATGSR
jgi:SAM-dependent methyltransferase